ncbi:MAG: hypothetical protein M5U05_18620 [Anaerolineales bacterium]|nr:hypothetical protein [Anaerolineales bacterium]
MFTGSNKDLRISRQYEAEMRRQAEEWHLARAVQEDEEKTGEGKKWIVRAVLIVVAVVALFAGAQQAFAQTAQPARVDAGGPPEPFSEAMRAYRVGLYYLKRADYERAVEWLTGAVAGIPEGVMVRVPAYQDMYWVLGEAQELTGLPADALVSYRQFLMLAGDEAAPWTFEKVQQVQAALDRATLVEVVLQR